MLDILKLFVHSFTEEGPRTHYDSEKSAPGVPSGAPPCLSQSKTHRSSVPFAASFPVTLMFQKFDVLKDLFYFLSCQPLPPKRHLDRTIILRGFGSNRSDQIFDGDP